MHSPIFRVISGEILIRTTSAIRLSSFAFRRKLSPVPPDKILLLLFSMIFS